MQPEGISTGIDETSQPSSRSVFCFYVRLGRDELGPAEVIHVGGHDGGVGPMRLTLGIPEHADLVQELVVDEDARKRDEAQAR